MAGQGVLIGREGAWHPAGTQRIMTVGRHIDEGEQERPVATGDFSRLFSNLAIAVKLIWRNVSNAGLI